MVARYGYREQVIHDPSFVQKVAEQVNFCTDKYLKSNFPSYALPAIYSLHCSNFCLKSRLKNWDSKTSNEVQTKDHDFFNLRLYQNF